MPKPVVHGLFIDPQFDFCDPSGSLYVNGAEADIDRLAALIGKLNLADIHVTLDSHPLQHIAHGVRWIGRDGKHPAPFTIISVADVEAGTWRASNPQLQGLQLSYVRTLAANGRYPLCIWPPHCLIGSRGATIMPAMLTALNAWCESEGAVVDFVPKGSNPNAEHYSGIMADVPDPSDPTTQINTRLIRTLEEADVILFAGEASSHCVANTLTDIVENFADPQYAAKIVVLEDCMSAVPGFADLYDAVKARYSGRVRFATSDQIIRELR